MKKFLQSNKTIYRLLRTIFQGIIGVIIANADFLISGLNFSPEAKAFIVALVMAILSPIMSELGAATETEEAIQETEELEEYENENNAAEEQ